MSFPKFLPQFTEQSDTPDAGSDNLFGKLLMAEPYVAPAEPVNPEVQSTQDFMRQKAEYFAAGAPVPADSERDLYGEIEGTQPAPREFGLPDAEWDLPRAAGSVVDAVNPTVDLPELEDTGVPSDMKIDTPKARLENIRTLSKKVGLRGKAQKNVKVEESRSEEYLDAKAQEEWALGVQMGKYDATEEDYEEADRIMDILENTPAVQEGDTRYLDLIKELEWATSIVEGTEWATEEDRTEASLLLREVLGEGAAGIYKKDGTEIEPVEDYDLSKIKGLGTNLKLWKDGKEQPRGGQVQLQTTTQEAVVEAKKLYEAVVSGKKNFYYSKLEDVPANIKLVFDIATRQDADNGKYPIPYLANMLNVAETQDYVRVPKSTTRSVLESLYSAEAVEKISRTSDENLGQALLQAGFEGAMGTLDWLGRGGILVVREALQTIDPEWFEGMNLRDQYQSPIRLTAEMPDDFVGSPAADTFWKLSYGTTKKPKADDPKWKEVWQNLGTFLDISSGFITPGVVASAVTKAPEAVAKGLRRGVYVNRAAGAEIGRLENLTKRMSQALDDVSANTRAGVQPLRGEVRSVGSSGPTGKFEEMMQARPAELKPITSGILDARDRAIRSVGGNFKATQGMAERADQRIMNRSMSTLNEASETAVTDAYTQFTRQHVPGGVPKVSPAAQELTLATDAGKFPAIVEYRNFVDDLEVPDIPAENVLRTVLESSAKGSGSRIGGFLRSGAVSTLDNLSDKLSGAFKKVQSEIEHSRDVYYQTRDRISEQLNKLNLRKEQNIAYVTEGTEKGKKAAAQRLKAAKFLKESAIDARKVATLNMRQAKESVSGMFAYFAEQTGASLRKVDSGVFLKIDTPHEMRAWLNRWVPDASIKEKRMLENLWKQNKRAEGAITTADSKITKSQLVIDNRGTWLYNEADRRASAGARTGQKIDHDLAFREAELNALADDAKELDDMVSSFDEISYQRVADQGLDRASKQLVSGIETITDDPALRSHLERMVQFLSRQSEGRGFTLGEIDKAIQESSDVLRSGGEAMRANTAASELAQNIADGLRKMKREYLRENLSPEDFAKFVALEGPRQESAANLSKLRAVAFGGAKDLQYNRASVRSAGELRQDSERIQKFIDSGVDDATGLGQSDLRAILKDTGGERQAKLFDVAQQQVQKTADIEVVPKGAPKGAPALSTEKAVNLRGTTATSHAANATDLATANSYLERNIEGFGTRVPRLVAEGMLGGILATMAGMDPLVGVSLVATPGIGTGSGSLTSWLKPSAYRGQGIARQRMARQIKRLAMGSSRGGSLGIKGNALVSGILKAFKEDPDNRTNREHVLALTEYYDSLPLAEKKLFAGQMEDVIGEHLPMMLKAITASSEAIRGTYRTGNRAANLAQRSVSEFLGNEPQAVEPVR